MDTKGAKKMRQGNRGPFRTHLSEKNLSKMGVPKHLYNFTLDDMDDLGMDERRKVIDYVKKYVENLDYAFDNNIGIFFYGANGVGKSTLASLIVKEAYRRRYKAKRCTFTEYITEFSKTWNTDRAEHGGEDDALGLFYHNFKAVDFLVIEELGKERESELALTTLEDLLRYREEKGLPTIICSNLSPKKVEERYAKSNFSLLRGNFQAIQLKGEDLRPNKHSNFLAFHK